MQDNDLAPLHSGEGCNALQPDAPDSKESATTSATTFFSRLSRRLIRETATRAFVKGAAWWEWDREGATMWGSDQQRAYEEAVRRYDDDVAQGRPPFTSPAEAIDMAEEAAAAPPAPTPDAVRRALAGLREFRGLGRRWDDAIAVLEQLQRAQGQPGAADADGAR